MNYPFLFLGAGQVEKSGWTHIYIKFKKSPEEDQIESISRHSPKHLKIYRDNFEGCMMFAMTVPVSEGLNNSLKTSDPDRSGDFRKQFGKDVEEWLLMIHSFCSIEVAFRPEVMEPHGTRLPPWHYESFNSLPGIMRQWEADCGQFTSGEREMFLAMMEELGSYVTTWQARILERLRLN